MTFDPGSALPADQTTVRRANLGVVLRDVASAGSRSRAQIAAETGLTRGTVSSLVAELIVLELLRETGETTSHRGVGRPGVALELADVVVGVGLEVNVDYVAVSVEDLTGAVRYERRSYRENRGSAPHPVLDRLGEAARTALEAAQDEGLRPVGISVAVPGLVEEASGTVVFAPNLGWEDIPVSSELEDAARASRPRRERVEPRRARRALDRRRGRDRRLRLRLRRGRRGRRRRARRPPVPRLPRVRRRVRPRVGRPRGPPLARAAAAAASRRSSARSRLRAQRVSPPSTGRSRSLTDELVRRAAEGSPNVVRALSRRRPVARDRARVDLQRPRPPGGRPRGLLRAAGPLARRRRPAHAARSARSRRARDRSTCSPRRSATAPPSAAPRRSRSAACSTRRGRCRRPTRCASADGVRPRRAGTGAGRRWRSVVASSWLECV